MALTLTTFAPQPAFEAACFGYVGLSARPKLKGDSAKSQIYGSCLLGSEAGATERGALPPSPHPRMLVPRLCLGTHYLDGSRHLCNHGRR